MTTRQDDPAEQLLDLLVYAPLGLLMEARELLPKLAEKGRRGMGGQVTVARMVGELAVRQGQRQAEKLLDRLRQSCAASAPGTAPDAGGRVASDDGAAPGRGRRAAAPAGPSRPTSSASAGGIATASSSAAGSASLAIPGYDTLSASQVLPRLEGLSPAELDAARAYEASTRGRKTVLSRIDQLRGRS